MASLVLIDISQLTADGFEKLPDQIMYPYAEPYDLQNHFGNQLKQLYVELYIKAITTELNTAIIAEEDQGVSRINAGLSKSYLKFANLVYEYKEIRRECIITAFSLNPTVECLELLKNSANANKAEGEEHNINRENSKVNELPTCDLHPPYIISNKSHGELCSQCGEFTGMKKKRLKRMQEGVVDGQDVIEEETESETESGDPYTYFIKVLEPLQLTKDLCHDFISILQNPRDKSFKVIADGTELESICNEYLNYKRTILKELKYLTIDYKVFDGIPRQEEGTGIEKGYEDFLDSTDSSCKRVHKDDVPPVSKRGKPKAKEKRIVKATKMKENEDQYYQWSDSSEHSVSNSDATYIPHSKDISTLDSDYSSGNTKKSKKMSISRNHSNLGSIDLNIQSNINFQNEREINLSTPELTPDSDILHSDLSHISPSYTPVEETYPIENTNFNTEELSGEPQFNECVRKPKFDDPEEVSELDEVAREFHGHFLAPMFYSPDLIPSTDTGLSNSIVDLTALDDSVASSPNPSYSPDNTQSTDIEGFTHSSMKANNLEDPCKSLPALVKYDDILDNTVLSNSYNSSAEGIQTDTGEYNIEHFSHNSPVEITVIDNFNLTVPSNANTQNSQISSNSNSGSPQTSEVNSPSQVALCSEDKSTSQSNSTIPVDSTQFAQSSTSEDFERLSSSTMSQNISQNTAGETNGTLRQQLVQSVLVSCLSSSSTNGSGDGNLSQNANPSDTLIAQSPLEPTVSSTTLEQLREFESVLEQVTNTSQMKERGSNCQQPHTRSQTILSPQLLITQQPSSNVHSNFISSDVPTSFSQNLFSAASTSSVSSASIPSSPSRVHVAYVSQSQTVRSNNIPSSNARISSTPVVVVTSYCQPVASPALSVTSQSSSSPCVTPAPIPSSSGTKSSKAKSSKSKSGKTSTSTATSRPSPVPRPQQKPQEDEQTAQRIYAILDEYAEQLRNSPDLKNKPAPRRRSNPPTNPNHSSKRKKSAQTKVKLLGQQSSSTAPEMSPGADDPRTFGSEDSSSGVTQLSHIQNSPAPSTQSADEMGSLRENSSLDASIEAGNLKSVVSDVGDVQGNCQPHRLIFTDANAMQGRAVILQDSVQTISDVTATSSNTSVKPVMMSNTATAVYVPSGLRQVFLPMAPGLTASVQGRPVVVSKGSKVIRVHQVTVPTSLQMSSGTSAVQGAALVVRQMCVKPSVSVATSVSVLNQTTVKQVKLPVGSISSQALSGVSAQPPVVLQPGNHQLAGPIASGETALPHTISFSEPTTQVTKSNVQTDFSRRDKASLVALDGGVSRSSMLGLIHRGMPVTFQDQLTIPIGETATSLSIHSHDRVVLPNIARTSPSSINDVIVTKKYGTKNVTSDTQHKKSWDCIVTVDDKVSTIQTNVAQKSNQQPEDNLSRKALQSSDLNYCSNAMEYSSPNRETSLIDVDYPMQNGSNEITVSISKTKIGDASSLETVKQSPLESKKSCTVTRQLPKYSPKSVLKSDDNVSSDLIGLICNTPLKHDQAQFEKDDTSNHHTSQSDQRSSNTDGIFGNPNERSLCTSPFTSKMPGTLVSHDELASEENLFSSVNSSVPASVTVRSPCAFDKFPKNIGQIMDQQIENFRHNSNNNSNSNSSSSDSILRCVAPDNGGSTIVSQGEGLGNPNQSKVGLLCKSSMSTLDCGNEIGYNMRPRVQQLGYANVSSYHLPTKMTLHKGGHWRYVPIVKKVKMPFRTVILQKDSEDAVMMMGHPSSSVNLTDSTSEVEDSSQENRTYLPDGKDSVVRKHNADHSLLSYHKLESSQQFEKSNDLLAMQQKARVERELRLQKSLSEECEDLGVDEPSTSDLFPEADLLLDTNSSPSFDQTLQDASCSQSLESAEHYPNANFKPLEYSSSSQESEQESHLKRQVKLDSKLQNETKHTAYKLNDELSEWQFETSKELKNKTIGESTREKKSKYRGNILKRRSLDVDTKAVPMKRALIGSTNEKPNDSHSHGMNEHLKISCNSTRTEIVSEKLANKTTRSINDTQSLSSNNAVTVASPGESSFSSSSDDSVTLLDSYTDNVVPLDVTVPICSSLPSQSNNISESKDLLPSVTQSVYTYSRIAGKGSKFIKGKDLKCTNQYLVNHLDSQELWDTSSSQERTVVDDEDSESLSRTEDLTSSPPDQSNSDVEIVELSNDSSHFSCVSYSHIPLMKLVVPRLEEILGVNNRIIEEYLLLHVKLQFSQGLKLQGVGVQVKDHV
uniref:Uncharacterized protein n=1 Tax=Timema cristinae TaxID=61476 RepID=A0A7R9CMV1_TIMCR|nr:unnamed protein product [Timema cristinae]